MGKWRGRGRRRGGRKDWGTDQGRGYGRGKAVSKVLLGVRARAAAASYPPATFSISNMKKAHFFKSIKLSHIPILTFVFTLVLNYII